MELIEHKYGCGGPAFYSLARGGAFNAYPSSHVNDIQTLAGGKPPVDEPLRCGTCGEVWHEIEPVFICVRAD